MDIINCNVTVGRHMAIWQAELRIVGRDHFAVFHADSEGQPALALLLDARLVQPPSDGRETWTYTGYLSLALSHKTP